VHRVKGLGLGGREVQDPTSEDSESSRFEVREDPAGATRAEGVGFDNREGDARGHSRMVDDGWWMMDGMTDGGWR
jgi:hypothetical protein